MSKSSGYPWENKQRQNHFLPPPRLSRTYEVLSRGGYTLSLELSLEKGKRWGGNFSGGLPFPVHLALWEVQTFIH